MTYLITEYIHGEVLSVKNKKTQYQAYKQAREYLKQINNLLTEKEKKIIGQRNLSYFTKTGLVLFPIAMIKDFKYYQLYIRAFGNFVKKIKNGVRDKQNLVHGDLSPENMIIKNDKTYLFDFEQSMITFESFEDATTVSTKKVNKSVRRLVSKLSIKRNKKAFSLMLLHVNVYNMIGVLAKKNGKYYRELIKKSLNAIL